MARYKSLIFLVPFTFLLGIAWGVRLLENQASNKNLNHADKIYLLMTEDFLPKEVINSFQQKTAIKLHITLAKTPQALIYKSLNDDAKFDIIEAYSFNHDYLKNSKYSRPLDKEINTAILSPDFIGIEGTNFFQTTLPLYWDVYSFIKANHYPGFGEKPFKSYKPKDYKNLKLTSSPEELYFTAKRHGVIVDHWIETDQINKLRPELAMLISLTQKKEMKAAKLIQAKLSEAYNVPLVDSDHSFYLPPEKGTLFFRGIAVSKESNKINKVNQLFNYLLSKKAVSLLAKHSVSPLTNTRANSLATKNYIKPSFFRSLSLGRIAIPFSHYAYESSWTRALKATPSKSLALEVIRK